MSQEHIQQALAKYQPTDDAIIAMGVRFSTLEVTGLDDRAGLAAVHEARMQVRGIRVQVEKTRKELKKDALEYGRRVDGEARRITELLLEVEEPLAEKESIVTREKERLAAIAAEERKAALQARLDTLTAVGFVGNPIWVQGLTDAEFAEAVLKQTHEHNARLDEEERRKADEAIAAQELAEEREKLRAEREALETAQKLVELQAAEAEANLQIERTAIRLARENQEAKEAESKRIQEIKEAKEQAVIDAKRFDEEAEADREALEAVLERLRPQYEKVHRWVNTLMDLTLPDVDCKSTIASIIGEAAANIRALAPTVKAEEVPE